MFSRLTEVASSTTAMSFTSKNRAPFGLSYIGWTVMDFTPTISSHSRCFLRGILLKPTKTWRAFVTGVGSPSELKEPRFGRSRVGLKNTVQKGLMKTHESAASFFSCAAADQTREKAVCHFVIVF